MLTPQRDILVLLKTDHMTEKAIEKEVECLNEMLRKFESPQGFCTAHELVDRNRITRNFHKILKESRRYNLRSFRFLLNKN